MGTVLLCQDAYYGGSLQSRGSTFPYLFAAAPALASQENRHHCALEQDKGEGTMALRYQARGTIANAGLILED